MWSRLRATWSPRYLVLVVVPIALTLLVWATFMSVTGRWDLFRTRGFMTIVMVVAGASSEGGGAVAYPAMTLLFDIDPAVARNFSLAIQSVGMTAAALYIVARRISVETTYPWLVAVGSVPGLAGGTYLLAPRVPPAYAKMAFVSFWLSYRIALWIIQPPMPLLLFSGAVFGFGIFLFFQLPTWGPRPAVRGHGK